MKKFSKDLREHASKKKMLREAKNDTINNRRKNTL